MSGSKLLPGRRAHRFLLSCLAVGATVFAAVAAEARPFPYNPILFVHGIEGSGAQFESQAMRFESNRYPASWIDQVDYDSTRAVADKSEVHAQIDAAIAELKARSGKAQVDVVAHSLGTSVMRDYLTDEELGEARRADVGHYINVDGQSEHPGVPTLAVWAGRGNPDRHMEGAENVTIPNQTHVQVCTSSEAFIEYFEFLTGRTPRRSIRRQSRIEISGKALEFPQNSGLAGATVEIWPVDENGVRTTESPVASIDITDGSRGGGKWGPVSVARRQRYEFALVRDALPTLHIYYEPFVRSDHTLRLLASTAFEQYAGNRPGSSSWVSIRYKELWGDQPGESDQLLVDGLNIVTAELCPASKQVNGYFAFDVNRNGQTDLIEDPVISALPFLQGADVFVRASTPPDGTISFQLLSRGGGEPRTLNVPNWEAMGDGITVQWNDFDRLTF
ncbi:MAG TPA: hypothetical protein VEC57_15680 [Candidatus Limnocylindrales bacterium]|nr:hypothetical protein [Candidatus Limnocylindrales bacterium]